VTDAVKLTTYFGERDRTDGRLLADALLDVYGAERIRASLLLRGAAGFGRIHHLHTDRLLSLSDDLPVVSIAVDAPARIESALERVLAITHRGLVTLERTRLHSDDALPQALPADPTAPETKLTVFLGRRDRADGRSAFVSVCELLHDRGIAGASALLGVDGTRHGQRQRARFFDGNHDVPMIVVAVGPSTDLTRVLPELAQLVPDPLLILEDVRVCKRDGTLLARPQDLPDVDDAGRAIWQKLTLYTSESATHDGRTLHLELIRRLRQTDAAGVTSLRGIWGFHGDHAPHGDRLLQLRRRVPVLTTLIDRPSQIARSFEIVDELTRESGLVTSEVVPAMLAISAARRIGGLELARPPARPARPARPPRSD
jgi:PII-like signaling protein